MTVANDSKPAIEKVKRAIEAVLSVSDDPISTAKLSRLFEEPAYSVGLIKQALSALQDDCKGRSIELKEVASGWRYQVRADYAHWVRVLWKERPPRYSRAVREILVLIAYRQPITRSEIASVRGVEVKKSMLDVLVKRQWIKVVGHRDVPGKPALYGTTSHFLDYFNLKSLRDLPPLPQVSIERPAPKVHTDTMA